MKLLTRWMAGGALLAFMTGTAAAQVGGFGGFGMASGSMLGVGEMNTVGAEQFSIRPWAMVTGYYSTNLTPRTEPADLRQDFYGGMGAYGITGRKAWQRTSLGVNFTGAYVPKVRGMPRPLSSHTVSLGVSHLLSPRTRVSLGSVAGYANGGMGFGGGFLGGGMALPFGMGAMMQMGEVDFGNPTDNGLVDNELFDIGTLFMGTSGGIVHRLGQRWNVGAGAGTFLTRRRYRGLQENQGVSAYAMTSYNIDRTSAVGVQYAERLFWFRGRPGENRVQSLNLFYRKGLSRTVTAGVAVGGFRFTSRFVGRVEVDPVLADLLGGFLGGFTAYEIREVQLNSFMGNAFILKSFGRGMVSAMYSRGVTPGNGIFFASRRDFVSLNATAPLGAGFSGGVRAGYGRFTGLQQPGLVGENYIGSGGIFRALGAGLGLSFSGGYREFHLANRPPLRSRFFGLGLSWMPSDAVLVF